MYQFCFHLATELRHTFITAGPPTDEALLNIATAVATEVVGMAVGQREQQRRNAIDSGGCLAVKGKILVSPKQLSRSTGTARGYTRYVSVSVSASIGTRAKVSN